MKIVSVSGVMTVNTIISYEIITNQTQTALKGSKRSHQCAICAAQNNITLHVHLQTIF